MKTKNDYFYHLIAICVVAIWGETFISTHLLIKTGLTPHEIFFLRFTIAYIGIWFMSPRNLFCSSLRDELRMLVGGITGGSFYFFTENTALEVSLTTNVAFIVCSTPLLTMLLTRFFYHNERITLGLLIGALLAILGVGLMIFNGSFVLHLSPLGDVLALMASLSWAIYSLIMKQMSDRYSTLFITRKVFFYGLLTILPVFVVHPWKFPLNSLLNFSVLLHLLFLGVLASLLCFTVWNIILKHLGTVQASNYIYLNPLFTSLGSLLFLDEPLTLVALLGGSCILCGVYIAERNKKYGIV